MGPCALGGLATALSCSGLLGPGEAETYNGISIVSCQAGAPSQLAVMDSKFSIPFIVGLTMARRRLSLRDLSAGALHPMFANSAAQAGVPVPAATVERDMELLELGVVEVGLAHTPARGYSPSMNNRSYTSGEPRT